MEASGASMTSNASTGWSLNGYSSTGALHSANEEEEERERHPHQGQGQGGSGPDSNRTLPPGSSACTPPSGPSFLVSASCQARLLMGAEALVEGRPRAALFHYSKAKAFGLLPCILVRYIARV